MRVLVTGGAGFIGGNLCRRLCTDGHEVVVLDNLSSGFRANLAGLDLDFREADIRDAPAVASAARNADSIVHLAARPSVPRSIADPALTNDINVNGTVNTLLAAREVEAHVIFASSSSVYGANEQLPKHEELCPRPVSPYAASKLAAESYVLAFRHAYGFPALAFRLFNVFGPRQAAGHAYAAVVPAFVDALLGGRTITVYGDGTQSRDFTPVASVVDVLSASISRRVSHELPVNLAFGGRTTLLELIATLEELTSLSARVLHEPERPGDVRASQADQTRLRRLFPEARARDLREGLDETIAWFRAEAAASA